MALTRDEILNMLDLTTKPITVPDSIPVWGGKELFIKQLSRGDQDNYLKSIYANGKVTGFSTEFEMTNMYGHDAWVCMRGISDSEGNRIFKETDLPKLEEKSGEFIGWCAEQILIFSDMDSDSRIAKAAAKKKAKEELKN
jgi:hypothetical protein